MNNVVDCKPYADLACETNSLRYHTRRFSFRPGRVTTSRVLSEPECTATTRPTRLTQAKGATPDQETQLLVSLHFSA